MSGAKFTGSVDSIPTTPIKRAEEPCGLEFSALKRLLAQEPTVHAADTLALRKSYADYFKCMVATPLSK